MFKGFLIGFLLAVVLIVGGVVYYFFSGTAPVATADSPMPFEKVLAKKALAARIEKAGNPPSPVNADEPTYLAGAPLYKNNCAGCHGLPGQPAPVSTSGMYPNPPQLFRGTGVTDDPASETHWKIVNGIRLTGMPSFKASLNDTEMWQISQLLAHAHELPDSAKKLLLPDLPLIASPTSPASPSSPPIH